MVEVHKHTYSLKCTERFVDIVHIFILKCVCVPVCVVPLFAAMAGPPSPANNTRLFLRDEHIRPECHAAQTRMIRVCTSTQTRQQYTIPSPEYQHTVAVLSRATSLRTPLPPYTHISLKEHTCHSPVTLPVVVYRPENPLSYETT